ncbi:hypothetical protein DZF91_05790 [Actinomadura logoneensis]|uniref:Uncharacterized protein n=1 Tax=Actinomadura logoneensis TaxID=2293572 RepID=A0A372JRI6_9ACTN|nr:DUF5713 family protein [Actinomadura logoneensis]RFU42632.1 hypothetical protein DZF91_05790 [Actinomadura logoneensis]
MRITNQKLVGYTFLSDMLGDDYYPRHLVVKGQAILRRLCAQIEADRPADLAALYAMTNAATRQFNDLQDELFEADSEIETVARDTIASDFFYVAAAYGFENADVEELVADRDW